jgi:hypothetical protein
VSKAASRTPLVWAGPIIRRLTPKRLCLWLASSEAVELQLQLQPEQGEKLEFDAKQLQPFVQQLQLAGKLYLYFLDLELNEALPTERWISYDLQLKTCGGDWQNWQQWAEDLVYPGRALPGFVIKPKVHSVLHGSCRKPHFGAGDGLVRADLQLKDTAPDQWPSLLMLSGDQIYTDDVAAPTLYAIHQLIANLDFTDETLPCATLSSAYELHSKTPYYYQREKLLPATEASYQVLKQLFQGAKKPVFTTDSAHNHLISMAEIFSMYLLVWSPAPWQGLELQMPQDVLNSFSPDRQKRCATYSKNLTDFQAGLGQVRRLMAHLPVAMMFDDHDITDDWNLTAEWEQTAYEHPFSRRIIGNALMGYLLFQGWGNAPEKVQKLLPLCQQALSHPGTEVHDDCINNLLKFSEWHYSWPTQPPLLVLDTRTQRWRSELSMTKPSGLMDWESITELQQQLLGHDAVLLVSPAPVFGVKLIETIQRIFTSFGKPLMVDAENWMTHPGSAYALLNLFRHPKTPRNFVILSGDVHYSFVFQVALKHKQQSPAIWQITSSGLKNEFPHKLLAILDTANRWLYASRSPLNWFTKRRRMKVTHHKPMGETKGRRLVNAAGIGFLELTPEGVPCKIQQLCADGETVSFELEKGHEELIQDRSL